MEDTIEEFEELEEVKAFIEALKEMDVSDIQSIGNEEDMEENRLWDAERWEPWDEDEISTSKTIVTSVDWIKEGF